MENVVMVVNVVTKEHEKTSPIGNVPTCFSLSFTSLICLDK